MTELKIITKSTYYVDIYDLEVFLSEKAGERIEVVGYNRGDNYDEEIVPPDTNQKHFRSEDIEVEEFLEEKFIDLQYGSFGAPLQWAADNGWIPYGSYIVSVDA